MSDIAIAAVVYSDSQPGRSFPAHLRAGHALRGLHARWPSDEPAHARQLSQEDVVREHRRGSGRERGEDRARAHGASGIICFEDAFHGRTMLTLALTSKTHPYKAGFQPFPGEVYRIPYAYCYRCSYSARRIRRASLLRTPSSKTRSSASSHTKSVAASHRRAGSG